MAESARLLVADIARTDLPPAVLDVLTEELDRAVADILDRREGGQRDRMRRAASTMLTELGVERRDYRSITTLRTELAQGLGELSERPGGRRA